MIFADKLIALRKKFDMTQEELAEKMDVSRQSVAKWEAAQSVPELSKIIKLSEIFGVSTDYLLKDEMDMPETLEGIDENTKRRVTMEEANAFLSSRKKAARPIAAGTVLCILSPICLILLAAASEIKSSFINENIAAGAGLCILAVMIAAAVFLFVRTGGKNSQYEYLEKEEIETEYGVEGMVKERRNAFRSTYNTCNALGAVICVLSVLPIFFGVMTGEENGILMVIFVCLMLAMVSIGVALFISVGVVWSSYEKLMQEGDYTKEKKREQKSALGAVSSAYWMVVTAVYFAVSFTTNSWHTSWIVWPIAGVTYPAVRVIVGAMIKKNK